MAVQTIIKNTVNLDEPIKKQILTDVLGGSDNQAHRFEVELTRGGSAVDLTGAEVYGYFIRPGDITVKLTGGVENGTAYVVLNEHCYVTPGRFSFAMKVRVGDVLHTVLLYEGCVAATQGEGVVDDGYTIPSLTEWMNNIRQANLLDNSDFTNPVNQRGTTSATQAGTYIIDRWQTDIANNAATVSVGSGGITCEPTSADYSGIYHKFERYSSMVGKTYTAAICVNNTWYCASFEMGNFGQGAMLGNVTVFSVPTMHLILRVQAGSAAVTIQKVALYEGSYTAETLPAYVPKGYAVELAECRRYYRKYATVQMPAVSTAAGWVAIAYDYTGMRVTPTVTASIEGVYIGGTKHTATGSVGTRTLPGTEFTLQVNGVTAYSTATVRFSSIELSSDL